MSSVRAVLRLCAFLVMILIITGLLNGQSQAQTPSPEIARVEIAQIDNSAYPDVTLYMRVADPHGERVNGLTEVNFKIAEDGVRVEITAFSGVNYEPISTLLVVDKSNSMLSEHKLAGAKQAALAFVDLMRPQDQAALIAFDNEVNFLQDFTTDHASLKAQIDALSIGNCTSWYEAVYTAAELMEQLSGRKSIILLSDGIDCREDFWLHNVLGYGSFHSFEEALDQAQKVETPVNAIALGREPTSQMGNEGYDEGRLTRIASSTGGEYYHTPTVDQLADLYHTLAVQAQEEYVITYRSPRPTYDGTRRNIQVEVVAGTVTTGQGTGGVTAEQAYLEKHLVTIDSDWRILAACMPMLLLALVLPLAYLSLRGWQKARIMAPSPAMEHSVPSSLPQSPAAQTCAFCGTPLRSGARFCSSCGHLAGAASLEASLGPRHCPNCYKIVRLEARFCSHCGYKF